MQDNDYCGCLVTATVVIIAILINIETRFEFLNS